MTRKSLILLHSPHLTYRLGSYFYSAALRSSATTTTTVAITYIVYYCHVTPRGISNYEIHLAIASCTHCHDQPTACTAVPSWRCSITSARLAVRDIEVRRNSGLSGKARSTLHALHAPLVRCACPFIEVTHIEHYRNRWILMSPLSLLSIWILRNKLASLRSVISYFC